MIFDSIKNTIRKKLGRSMTADDMELKNAIESHPALKMGPDQPRPSMPDMPGSMAGQQRMLPGMDSRRMEMMRGPEQLEPGYPHSEPSGEQGFSHEFYDRLGIPGRAEERPVARELAGPMPPGLDRISSMGSRIADRPRPAPSGSSNEEMDMIMKELDMIRSQNELILQKLRMIEKRLG